MRCKLVCSGSLGERSQRAHTRRRGESAGPQRERANHGATRSNPAEVAAGGGGAVRSGWLVPASVRRRVSHRSFPSSAAREAARPRRAAELTASAVPRAHPVTGATAVAERVGARHVRRDAGARRVVELRVPGRLGDRVDERAARAARRRRASLSAALRRHRVRVLDGRDERDRFVRRVGRRQRAHAALADVRSHGRVQRARRRQRARESSPGTAPRIRLRSGLRARAAHISTALSSARIIPSKGDLVTPVG